MSDLKAYKVTVHGTETTVQLSEEDVKRYKSGGVKMEEVQEAAPEADEDLLGEKEASTPANKAASAPATKAAATKAAAK